MNQEEYSRAHDRVSKLLMTVVERFDDDGVVINSVVGQTINVSAGGILVNIEQSSLIGERVSIIMAFPDDVVTVEGEVVHLQKKDDGIIQTGIRFDNLSDKGWELLNESPGHE